MTTGPRALRVVGIAVTFVLVLCFSAAAAQANTFTVNNSGDTSDANPGDGTCDDGAGHCTLRAAIEEANALSSDDTIDVPAADNPPGRYDRADDNGQYTVANNGSLTIDGTTGDPKDVLISADGDERVLEEQDGAHLTIDNVTLQDGLSFDCVGGGVLVDSDATLTMNNSRVNRNIDVCDGSGGGIYGASGSTLTLNGSHVDNNNSVGGGGGIAYEGDLTLTDSTVDGNTSSYSYESGGGGIYDAGTSLSITRSSVSHNSDDGPTDCTDCYYNAISAGGGIFNVGEADISITDSHVDNNFEDGFGGGIASFTGAITLTRSTVDNNQSSVSDGGGIWDSSGCECGAPQQAASSALTISDSEINGNDAYDEGAGIYYDQSDPLSVTGSTLNGNRTYEYGGGAMFVAFGAGDASVSGSTLNDNVADSDGGAILYRGNGSLSVANDTFDGNTAYSDGGAIYNDPAVLLQPQQSNGPSLTVDSSKVTNNFASSRGGGIANFLVDATITKTTVDDNEARYDTGGGIYVGVAFGNSLTLSDGSVSGNRTSDGDGGGIWTDASQLSLTRMQVDRNLAKAVTYDGYAYSGNGGGIYSEGDSTSIVDSSVSKNVADVSGGGLFEDSSTSTIQNSTFGDNQADALDQGINANPGVGGGIYNEGATMTLTNATISGNFSPTGDGGGIFNDESATFKNTIVADNQANGSDTSNCGGSGEFTTNGNNIDGKNQCNFTDPSDQTNTDPRLGPLQDNGGNTLTFALSDGSPAIDKGDDAACHDPVGDHDQRQAPRPIGAHCDIGAYEAYALGDLAITKGASPSPVGTNSDLTYTLHATNNGPDKMLSVAVSDPVPSGVTLRSVTSSQGSCDNSVSCNLGVLAPGDTATITIVVHTGSGSGTVTNTARVSAQPTATAAAAAVRNVTAAVTSAAPADPDTSNNSATVQTSVVAPTQAPAIQQNQTPPTVTAGPKACSSTPPRTSISRPALHASSSALSFVGRSIDLRCVAALGIKKVQVAVAFKATAHTCRWVKASGALTGPRSCRKPVWIKARRGKLRNGKVPWTFRMRSLHLPRGAYVVEARGIDAHNDVEKKLRRYNRKSFRIG